MKSKKLIYGGLVLGLASFGLYYWKKNNKKELKPIKIEENEQNSKQIYQDPKILLKNIIERELEEDMWVNERDFLSRIVKEFIKEANVSWIHILPSCLEDLYDQLEKMELLKEFEIKLEGRYCK